MSKSETRNQQRNKVVYVGITNNPGRRAEHLSNKISPKLKHLKCFYLDEKAKWVQPGYKTYMNNHKDVTTLQTQNEHGK